jgi:type I restriction enzyme M protein
LLIDKQLAKTNEEILFVKIDNDGYGLGAQRNAVKGGQLAQAIELLKQFKDNSFIESEIAHSVPKAEIAKNGDYNLSGERYKSQISLNSDFPIVELKEVADVISGQSPSSEFYNDNADGLPFYQGKTEFTEMYIGAPTKWTTEITKEAFENDILMSVRAPVGPVNYATQHICIGRGLAAIRVKEKIKKDFLFYLLKSQEGKIKGNGGAVFDSISRNKIEAIQIPLPPLSIQEEIVAEIEGYQKIIDGAKMVVENYKPKIDIDLGWEMVRFGDISNFKNGLNFSKESTGEKIKILGVSHFKNYLIAPISELEEIQVNETINDGYLLKKGDIVFVRSNGNPDLVGRSIIIPEVSERISFSGFTIRCRLNGGIEPFYIGYLFKSDFHRELMKSKGRGANISNLSQEILNDIIIPIPPLATQRQIVSRIEKEQELVNSAKQLIGLFEQKIKDRIARVWGEEKADTEQEFGMAAEPLVKYKTS